MRHFLQRWQEPVVAVAEVVFDVQLWLALLLLLPPDDCRDRQTHLEETSTSNPQPQELPFEAVTGNSHLLLELHRALAQVSNQNGGDQAVVEWRVLLHCHQGSA